MAHHQPPAQHPHHVPMYRPSTEKTPVVQVVPGYTPLPLYSGFQQPTEPLAQAMAPTTNEKKTNKFWYTLTSPLRPMTYQLIVFHLVNFLFAVIAFVIVVAVGSVGIATIPIFCLGLVVLQVLLYVVHFFANVDAHLYNCIAPKDEQIIVQFHVPTRGLYQVSGYRISPDLSRISTESFAAVFYFVFVKFPLAVAFSSSVLALLVASITLIMYPYVVETRFHSQLDHFRTNGDTIHIGHLNIDDLEPGQVVGIGIVLLYLTIGFLHLFGKVHRATTKFFTCEFFATSGYVVQGSIQPHFLSSLQYAVPPLGPQPTVMNTPIPAAFADNRVTAPSLHRNAFERFASKFGSAILLAVFAWLSLIFSIGMFAVVISSLFLTIGSLPAACVGLLVLQVLVWLVQPLSKVDAWLFEQRQRIYTELLRDH
ncbi:hypothetical protein H310_12343 [Aphanomyces invadans]|uniref:Uncharacterized protein n=1 Tax=Aphanomyces invadans TaxID=157072 RepID=A0A024TIE7_9STRA|nr:hypothetical protein H310_12343 [Aphanomyces invadans]ETV93779.1 hypothetical protein H310_12343 [Aphanomyces invadans]RHY20709.1 hypothetical protein DYB32_009973 [Aphanomyces invadans]|eukprot:XP_008877588.1 hypothetical protein H310_12343 [Aphanomyces invadans]